MRYSNPMVQGSRTAIYHLHSCNYFPNLKKCPMLGLRKGNLAFSSQSSTEMSLIALNGGWRLQGDKKNILIKKKCIAWMHCKSLWIKASAKCINVIVGKWVNHDKQPKLELNEEKPYILLLFILNVKVFSLTPTLFLSGFIILHIYPSISLFCLWWQTLISSLAWFIRLNLSAIEQLRPWGNINSWAVQKQYYILIK